MKFLTATLLVAIATAPALANQSYDINVVKQPDQKWRFQRLTAYESDDGIRVKGRLTATQRFGLPRGHVDIAAYSPTGKLIAETTTNYTPAILTHTMKKKGGVRFSAHFGEKLPSQSVIKVAFHRDESRPKVSPSHSGNIAR